MGMDPKNVEQEVEQFMQYPYAIVIEKDICDTQPCFVAYNPELSGCMAQGNTQIEAVVNLSEARRELITVLLEEGIKVPLPMPLCARTDRPTHELSLFERDCF